MKKLHILPIGNPDARLLEWLQQALADKFHVRAEVLPVALDPAFAVHKERQQFHSSEILGAMQRHVTHDTWRLLGVTEKDLYIPILTFVFGEAQMGGQSAIVSYHRLTQQFYGLPADMDLLANRLLIESVHELGHTLHLTHCQEFRCAMSSSHAVEYIDLKDSGFCDDCLAKVDLFSLA
jgi:archaemetzincin